MTDNIDNNETKNRSKRGLLVILILLICVLCIAGIGFGAVLFLNQPTALLKSNEQSFTILKGENIHSVAENLARKGYIRSSLFLRLMVRTLKTETLFKAGTYTIPAGSTVMEIHDLFVSGTQTIVKVTIPEGFTLSRIAALLEEKGLVKADDFKAICGDKEYLTSMGIQGKNAEGFLFPDTYFFSDVMSGSEIATIMIRNFFTKLSGIYPEYQTLSRKDLYDKVILASIVEREYRRPEEASKIASVFYNRLKINMGLGSCATVEYIITEIEGKPHPEVLKKEDLEIKSDYNTYMWAGLPPGPISNPGVVALKAVFFPEKTDYMYFLLKDPSTGEHVFTEDIEEHNRAKYLYLKKSP